MSLYITWERFEAENQSPADAFETIARRIAALQIEIASWEFSCPKSWPGVEADPIEVEGKWHSLQAKYYTKPDDGWKALESSLETAAKQIKAGNYCLDICHVFVNWDRPRKRHDRSRDAVSKPEKCEAIAKKAGFKVVWNWGNQILERLQSENNPLTQKSLLQFFTQPEQPSLHQPFGKACKGISKYHYADEKHLDFVERKDVTRILEQCVDSDANFLWHTIVGSAGVGKSRAMLEFCHSSLAKDWSWGWLLAGSKFDFDSWVPSKDTLVIVDYAMGRGPQLRELLEACVKQSDSFLFKVRVVVAERMIDPWLSTVTSSQTTGSAISSSALRQQNDGTPDATKIQSFNAQDREALVSIILKKYPSLGPEPKKLVDTIRKIDPEFRPLIAWLYVDHLSRDEDLRSAKDLLRSYLQLQRDKHWLPGGVTLENEKDAALITMCQGLSSSVSQNWGPNDKARVAKINARRHEIILGANQQNDTLSPIEPDILGELHVLNLIKGNNALDDSLAEELVGNAVSLNAQGLIGFLFRAANSFPGHSSFNKLLRLKLNPDLKGQILYFLVLGLNQGGPGRDRQKVLQQLTKLRNLATSFPSPALDQCFVASLANASHGFSDESDLQAVLSMRHLAEEILEQRFQPQTIRAFSGAVDNLCRVQETNELTFEERDSLIMRWMELTKTRDNDPEATRSVISVVSSILQDAIQKDLLVPSSESEHWLSLLDRLASRQPQDEYTYSAAGGALIEAYKRLPEIAHGARSRVGDHICERVVFCNDTQISHHATELYSETQRLKKTGSGNPDAYRMLGDLADKNDHAINLFKHAFDPDGI